MAAASRRRVIVTFKLKEQRPDRLKDKIGIVSGLVTLPLTVVDIGAMPKNSTLPVGLADENIAFDINTYETPLVIASLTEQEISALQTNPNVDTVEDDGLCYALHDVLPRSDVVVEGLPDLSREIVPAGVARINAVGAWESSKGRAIKVAVLDTGIDAAHPDLQPNYRGGISFIPGEGSPVDFNGHGTHCAGTIAAAMTGRGIVGVAPAAYLYAVKVLSRTGSGAWSSLIAGISWCVANGIRILNMSLGGPEAPRALERMCDFAWKKGLLLVAAAGNSGPAMGSVTVPARYPSVLAVSAIDDTNVIAEFSSRGPEIELCAPGVNVLSTRRGNGYHTLSGTSMACPHVSGAATAAWGAHRYADNVTIRRLLAWTAGNLGIPGRDPLFGFGRVDAEQAACAQTEPPAISGIP